MFFNAIFLLSCLSFFHRALVQANAYDTATYYDVSNAGIHNLNGKNGYNACGSKSTNGEDLVAMNYRLFDKYTPNNNPNKNSICYRQIWVWNTNVDRAPVRCTIVDRMADASRGENALDLTPTAFKKLSPSRTLSEGVINIGWSWI